MGWGLEGSVFEMLREGRIPHELMTGNQENASLSVGGAEGTTLWHGQAEVGRENKYHICDVDVYHIRAIYAVGSRPKVCLTGEKSRPGSMGTKCRVKSPSLGSSQVWKSMARLSTCRLQLHLRNHHFSA
jgi:hypothetical protein